MCLPYTSENDFPAAARILASTSIFFHHAAIFEQADFQLARTGAGVLLTELTFQKGSWADALEMLAECHPRVALVLSAAHPDERLWIAALERGAFDAVEKPFRAEELRRVLENADDYSRRSMPPQTSIQQSP